MNNFFENHIDEINSISIRSKKEKKKTFTRLQKANTLNVKFINGKFKESYTKCIEGINVHQFTNDGKALIGSSDRVYLPDVATRLYQNINNIALAYKSHKCHINQTLPSTFSDGISDIKFFEYSQFDLSEVKKYFEYLYNNISEQVRDNFDISFNFEKIYSIWSLYTDLGQYSEFDETFCFIEYTFTNKKTKETISSGIIELPADFQINSKYFPEEIKYVDRILARSLAIKLINIENIDPEFIYLDFISAYRLFEDNSYTDLKKNNERFDKFGNEIDKKNGNNTTQRFYYDSPREFFANLKLDKTKHSLTDEEIDLENHQIKNKFLYSFHSKDTELTGDKAIFPGILFYFDGNKLFQVKADMIDLKNIDESDIKLNISPENSITRRKSGKFFNLSGIKNAIVKFSNSIKLL